MNTSNFDFIQEHWPDLYRNALRAEQNVYTAPRTSAFYSRLCLEMAVRWMYENDYDLEYPYNDSLSGLLFEQSFKSMLRRSLFQDIDYVRKIGNDAAHKRRANSNTEALESLKNIFRFFNWMARNYLEDAQIQQFDQSLVPKEGAAGKTMAELQVLDKKYQEQVKKDKERIEAVEEENKQLKEALAKIKQENITKHAKDNSKQLSVPRVRSEAETRKLYIDRYLAEAGWDIQRKNEVELEYKVTGMPNNKGVGYVDYVLFGDDGLPLAVVEAKRSSKSPETGQQQAKLYADCLEQMTGQRPFIFYSNGLEHYLWDDLNYSPRQVSGFYTKQQLQRLLLRRKQAKDITGLKPDPTIAGRYYQQEAIGRVMGHLNKKYRETLLVMATGSGKTRVAISMVDLLIRANWVHRVLFLADRVALVSQAKKNFGLHLKHLSSINLTTEKNNDLSRLVFSTYPTMMNAIEGKRADDKRADGRLLFSPGHFDLIIIDEAHRSIYKKYQVIFDYFDAIQIGLTATPKSEVDKNTYELFGCADQDPTFDYTLEQAVADGYLNPPKRVSIPTKFIQEGIKYKELSKREQREYEEKFYGGEEEEEFQEEISASALNNWLFNDSTVDKVLKHVMEWGQKIEEGDKLGKTIFFAKNKKHAQFILERFEKNYPQYAGNFAKVVVNGTSYVQTIIDDFSTRQKMPQIAISVDMLDTGIDVPDVLNLVFFKRVRSFAKFWQMIGRGTRLCEDVFGIGQHKAFFSIFDVCGNFEYFGENPEGIEGKNSKSLAQRTFEVQLDIAQELRNLAHQDDEAQQAHRVSLLDNIHQQLNNLDKSSFVVRPHLELLAKFEKRAALDTITASDVHKIKDKLSLLISSEEKDHQARRFDAQMYRLELNILKGKSTAGLIENTIEKAKALAKLGHLTKIKDNKDSILEAAKSETWEQPTLIQTEKIRKELRGLMNLLDPVPQVDVFTSFEDDLEVFSEDEVIYTTKAKPHYKLRVERFIEENNHHITIQKLRNNQPITKAELEEMERILFEQTESTKSEFEETFGAQPLGQFIRKLVGLDVKAAKDAFADFLNAPAVSMTANQIHFINQIIDYLNQEGTISAAKLYEPPFSDNGDVEVIFGDSADSIFSIIKIINGNAVGA